MFSKPIAVSELAQYPPLNFLIGMEITTELHRWPDISNDVKSGTIVFESIASHIQDTFATMMKCYLVVLLRTLTK